MSNEKLLRETHFVIRHCHPLFYSRDDNVRSLHSFTHRLGARYY